MSILIFFHMEFSTVVLFLEYFIFEAPLLTPLYPYYLHILFNTKYRSRRHGGYVFLQVFTLFFHVPHYLFMCP
jgi:hypothetical protein